MAGHWVSAAQVCSFALITRLNEVHVGSESCAALSQHYERSSATCPQWRAARRPAGGPAACCQARAPAPYPCQAALCRAALCCNTAPAPGRPATSDPLPCCRSLCPRSVCFQITVRAKGHTRFSKLLAAFCTRRGLEPDRWALQWGGRALPLEDCPSQYGIIDGDELRVVPAGAGAEGEDEEDEVQVVEEVRAGVGRRCLCAESAAHCGVFEFVPRRCG